MEKEWEMGQEMGKWGQITRLVEDRRIGNREWGRWEIRGKTRNNRPGNRDNKNLTEAKME